MSDLRRPLLTVVTLGAVCLLIGLFVFPGPGRPQPQSRLADVSHLGSVSTLGTITPQTSAPQSPPPTTLGFPSGQGQSGARGETVLAPTTTTLPPLGDPASTTTTTAAPATTTTTIAPANDCGGQAAVNLGGQPWNCTFDDEFNGTSLDTTMWTVQKTSNSGYHSGQECFEDDPNNVSESGGTLNLTVRQVPQPFTCTVPLGFLPYSTQYTSGEVTTYHTFSQTYGLFEVRAKFPDVLVRGLQSTLWLWPVNSRKYGLWPDSGEIDFAEWFSQYGSMDIPTVHYDQALGASDPTTARCAIVPGQFHTYGVAWTPDALTILLDGNVCFTDKWQPAFPQSKPEPFDQPFLLSLTQALGIDTNQFVPGTVPLPATTQIDWVRVWG
jgi:beta-glucanase (GH16 family)